MVKRVFQQLLLVFSLLCGVSTTLSSQSSFRVMFYNVENLFDCKHDSLKNDLEFLPTGTYRWSPKRYYDKVTKIAKVIIAAGDEQVPDLVGLCEVENDYCLTSLTHYSPLREAGYRYVMTDSPDRLGIDVALLYQRATFKLLSHQAISIPHESINRSPTRDILHVTGALLSGDTLDVFVCHFPSKSGGAVESEPFRLLAATTLRQATDSVMRMRLHPNVLIMGDFNDDPKSRSLAKVLQAHPVTESIEVTALYNLMHGRKGGTYRYRGEWSLIDQFIVSGNLLLERSKGINQAEVTTELQVMTEPELLVTDPLLNSSLLKPHHAPRRIITSFEQVQVLRFPFLLQEDDRYGGDTPFRTYHGRKYRGGFSDHLPILLHLSW